MAPIILRVVTFFSRFFFFLLTVTVVVEDLFFTVFLDLVLISLRVRFLLVGRVVCTLHRSVVIAASLGVASNVGVLPSYVRLINLCLVLLFAWRNGIGGRFSMLVHRSR
jgi:hypothetical protein